MATIEQVRERYLIKSEKNGTNDNITTDNYRFSLLFNESQNKFITLHLQQRGVDDVRYIQNFLILDKSIPFTSKSEDKYNFELPKDYFDLSDVRAKAEKDNCRDYLSLFEVRTENLNEVMQDEYHKPSFEWRESFYTINSNKLSIYTDRDFKVSEILLNYYRYPNQIKLLDEMNPESGFEDTAIEWDDKTLDDIVSLMVANNDMNENNPRFQLNLQRTQK
jgi:hypothetical protein